MPEGGADARHIAQVDVRFQNALGTTDVSVVGSSLTRVGSGLDTVLVDDRADDLTYTVMMAQDTVTGLLNMSCTCGDDIDGLCVHCCFLVLRVARLRDPMVFLEAGRARDAAVRRVIRCLEARDGREIRPWPEVARIRTPPPRQEPPPRDDVDPPAPTDECPVCYEAFAGQRCVRCGRCAHLFHRACAARWGRSCPTCRDDGQFRDLAPEQRGRSDREERQMAVARMLARYSSGSESLASLRSDDEIEDPDDSAHGPEPGRVSSPNPVWITVGVSFPDRGGPREVVPMRFCPETGDYEAEQVVSGERLSLRLLINR